MTLLKWLKRSLCGHMARRHNVAPMLLESKLSVFSLCHLKCHLFVLTPNRLGPEDPRIKPLQFWLNDEKHPTTSPAIQCCDGVRNCKDVTLKCYEHVFRNSWSM